VKIFFGVTQKIFFETFVYSRPFWFYWWHSST